MPLQRAFETFEDESEDLLGDLVGLLRRAEGKVDLLESEPVDVARATSAWAAGSIGKPAWRSHLITAS